MDAAKDVLKSEEVKEAVDELEKKGGDGKSAEKKAYEGFLKSLDDEKKAKE